MKTPSLKDKIKVLLLLIFASVVLTISITTIAEGSEKPNTRTIELNTYAKYVPDSHNVSKTPAHDKIVAETNGTVTTIEGKFSPYIDEEITIICKHSLRNRQYEYYKVATTADKNGYYSVTFNNDQCDNNDEFQICTEGGCSAWEQIEPSIQLFKDIYSGANSIKTKRTKTTEIAGVPEYSTVAGGLLILLTGAGIAYMRRKLN